MAISSPSRAARILLVVGVRCVVGPFAGVKAVTTLRPCGSTSIVTTGFMPRRGGPA